MAKAGVLALTQSLAVEWGPKGIRTVAISPGTFPTKGAWDRLVPASMAKRWESASPVGRSGEHSELAESRRLSRVRSGRLHQRRLHHHRWWPLAARRGHILAFIRLE